MAAEGTYEEHGWPVAPDEFVATAMANSAMALSGLPNTIDEIFAGNTRLLLYLKMSFSMKDPGDEQQQLCSAVVELFVQNQTPFTNTPCFAWQDIGAIYLGTNTKENKPPYVVNLHTGAIVVNIPSGVGKDGLKDRVVHVLEARKTSPQSVESVSDRDVVFAPFSSNKTLVTQLEAASEGGSESGSGSRHTVLFTPEGGSALQILFDGGQSPESQAHFIKLHELGARSFQVMKASVEGTGENSASTIILSNAETNKSLLLSNGTSRKQMSNFQQRSKTDEGSIGVPQRFVTILSSEGSGIVCATVTPGAKANFTQGLFAKPSQGPDAGGAGGLSSSSSSSSSSTSTAAFTGVPSPRQLQRISIALARFRKSKEALFWTVLGDAEVDAWNEATRELKEEWVDPIEHLKDVFLTGLIQRRLVEGLAQWACFAMATTCALDFIDKAPGFNSTTSLLAVLDSSDWLDGAMAGLERALADEPTELLRVVSLAGVNFGDDIHANVSILSVSAIGCALHIVNKFNVDSLSAYRLVNEVTLRRVNTSIVPKYTRPETAYSSSSTSPRGGSSGLLAEVLAPLRVAIAGTPLPTMNGLAGIIQMLLLGTNSGEKEGFYGLINLVRLENFSFPGGQMKSPHATGPKMISFFQGIYMKNRVAVAQFLAAYSEKAAKIHAAAFADKSDVLVSPEEKEALEQPYFSVALRFGTGKKKKPEVAMLHLVIPTFITPLLIQARCEGLANLFRNLSDMGLTERDLNTEFLIGIQSGSADRESLKATITSRLNADNQGVINCCGGDFCALVPSHSSDGVYFSFDGVRQRVICAKSACAEDSQLPDDESDDSQTYYDKDAAGTTTPPRDSHSSDDESRRTVLSPEITSPRPSPRQGLADVAGELGRMHALVLPKLRGDATAALGAAEVGFELPSTVSTTQAHRYYMGAPTMDIYGVESALVELGVERSTWPATLTAKRTLLRGLMSPWSGQGFSGKRPRVENKRKDDR